MYKLKLMKLKSRLRSVYAISPGNGWGQFCSSQAQG